MTALEFSRPVRLPDAPREVVLEAEPAERAALARRFGIVAVHRLRAVVRLEPEPGGSVRARGRLEAEVEQDCVVTLEPVRQEVKAELDLRILGAGEEPGDDDPESVDEVGSSGGAVELGEVVAEELALALDPYPRAEGAVVPELDGELDGEEVVEEVRENPFARLAGLKRG